MKIVYTLETLAYLLLAALALVLGLIAQTISQAVAPVLALERRWRARNLVRIQAAQAIIRASLARRIAPAQDTVTDES